MTPSEQFVFNLCRRSALSLWSYSNPRRPDGRELCDVLIAFDRSVVIFSVKDVALKEHADPGVAAKRWIREAVEYSTRQLNGARRELGGMAHVVRHDGSDGVVLPPAEDRRVHLVAIAVGGNRRIPFAGGGNGSGSYVHVMDEEALRDILGELDTAPDFLHYLETKEAFAGNIICEGEENLFALYLHRGRRLPNDVDMLFAEDGLWRQFQLKPEVLARKNEDQISYWWDRMIETFVSDYEVGLEAGPSPSELERIVRTMASEDRFSRRALSASFLEWLRTKQAGARSMKSPSSKVGYVFGTFPRDWDREFRQTNMSARCFVARSPAHLNCSTVVGLATEIYDPAGYSMDGVYLHMPGWAPGDDAIAAEAQQRFGIMEDPAYRDLSMAEFPSARRRLKTRSERNREKRERRKRR